MVLLNNKTMKEEDKELLLKDLCARVPYGLMCACGKYVGKLKLVCPDGDYCILQNSPYTIETIKPYLRPMSSMTEEEILELYKITYITWYSDSLYYKNEEFISFRDSIQNNSLCFKNSIWIFDINKVIDWLNSHHFDYRGLIKKGLALEAPKDMYVINQ